MDIVAGLEDVFIGAGCDSCATEANDSASGAGAASPGAPDDVTSIDEAVRLTIAGMPNALRLLENS